jgi:hypothetical protein
MNVASCRDIVTISFPPRRNQEGPGIAPSPVSVFGLRQEELNRRRLWSRPKGPASQPGGRNRDPGPPTITSMASSALDGPSRELAVGPVRGLDDCRELASLPFRYPLVTSSS